MKNDRTSELEVRSKIWLERDGEPVFGQGREDLLRLIRKTGSINAAAKAMGISYRKAWTYIDAMEKRLGFPLVIRQKGGAGGDPVVLGIAEDKVEQTCDRIREGMRGDLLITTGGVSVGDRDCVKEAIVALGGEIKFWKVHMKPGKPVAFAMLEGKPVFALPGNPAAAMISFEVFVRPALLKMIGHTRIFRPTVTAALTEPIANKGDRPLLLLLGWARVKEVSAVAALFILVNSIAGLLGHISSLQAMPRDVPILAVAALAGGITGSFFGSCRIPASRIVRALSVVLVIAGFKLLLV